MLASNVHVKFIWTHSGVGWGAPDDFRRNIIAGPHSIWFFDYLKTSHFQFSIPCILGIDRTLKHNVIFNSYFPALAKTFLMAILHCDLRNGFFFFITFIYFFSILIWTFISLLFPFSIWTFISFLDFSPKSRFDLGFFLKNNFYLV